MKDLIPLARPTEHRPITSLMRPAVVRAGDQARAGAAQAVPAPADADAPSWSTSTAARPGWSTIEDLLEEIVGEIRDEYDEESEPIVDEGNGVFVFSGKVDIDEVGERLGVEIEREGFETVGGYLLSHLGRVPAVGRAVRDRRPDGRGARGRAPPHQQGAYAQAGGRRRGRGPRCQPRGAPQ